MSEAGNDVMEGGCACGGVRYRMMCAPMFVHCCHCTWCQRESGAAFALNALIEAANVEVVKGESERVLTPSNSGRGQIFTRCSDCRIALWSNYSGAGNKVHFIRVGTLDQAGLIEPDIHIFTSTKVPWVQLPDDVPVMKEYYRRSTHWSPDSLERYNAARAS